MFVGGIIREDGSFFAELLQIFLTTSASAAGVHEAANTRDVTGFEFLHLRANLDHAADDFMPWNAGIGRAVPFIADGV